MKVILTRNIQNKMYALIQTEKNNGSCVDCVFRHFVTEDYYECKYNYDFACFRSKSYGDVIWVDIKELRKLKLEKLNENNCRL